jgi:hypothetical protein
MTMVLHLGQAPPDHADTLQGRCELLAFPMMEVMME